MLPAALLGLTAALVLPGAQAYVLSFDGADVGYAELTVERTAPGRFAYAFHAELTVCREPCLSNAESSKGEALVGPTAAGETVFSKELPAGLPEELFVALAPDLGTGCRAVRGAGHTGTGCWTQVSGAAARGTLFGEPLDVTYGANQLPGVIRYEGLGLEYRAVAAIPAGLFGCQRAGVHAASPAIADEGVAAPGGTGVEGRALSSASFALKTGLRETRRPLRAIPKALGAIVAEVRARELHACQVVAAALERALAAHGFESRQVVGLLLDGGRYYPHAWNEVRVGRQWLGVDASTGEGWADAGRVRAGLLGVFDSGLALLRLLHAPPTVVSHD